MKKIFFYGTLLLLFILFVINIHIFVRGIELSNDIQLYEQGIKVLHKENIDLEKKLYQVDSLSNASSLSAELKFTKKSQPIKIENLPYALNHPL